MISRVKKNQELYDELSQNAESDLSNSNLSSFSSKLNHIDHDSETVSERQSIHSPLHARDNSNESSPVETYDESVFSKPSETSSEENQEIKELLWNTFENTYLNEFLSEVKQYNVKKGYRRVEDTQANIMAELKSGKSQPTVSRVDSHNELYSAISNQENTYQSVDQTMEYTPTMLNSDANSNSSAVNDQQTIALEVQKMVNDISFEDSNADHIQQGHDKPVMEQVSYDESVAEKKDSSQQPINEHKPVSSLKADLSHSAIENNSKKSADAAVSSAIDKTRYDELLQSTQQLQLKVDDYEQNLEEINGKVALTNRVITFLLYLLIIALIIVICLFVVWMLQG